MIIHYEPRALISTPDGLIESKPNHDHPSCEKGKPSSICPRCPGCQWQRLIDGLLLLPHRHVTVAQLLSGGSLSDN